MSDDDFIRARVIKDQQKAFGLVAALAFAIVFFFLFGPAMCTKEKPPALPPSTPVMRTPSTATQRPPTSPMPTSTVLPVPVGGPGADGQLQTVPGTTPETGSMATSSTSHCTPHAPDGG